MLPEWFVLVAVALNLVCATGGYVVAVFKGNAQPNRVTWFGWGLAPLIAFVFLITGLILALVLTRVGARRPVEAS